MSLSLLSFWGFIVLNALLAWAVGFLLWRRIRRREKAVHGAVAVMLAFAFAFGALWFNFVHVRTFEPVPDNVPTGDTSPVGRVILAGVAGVILLAAATAMAVSGYAAWVYFSRPPGDPPERAGPPG